MTATVVMGVGVAHAAGNAQGSGGKKGLGLAESAGGTAADLAALKVHWYYNWGAQTALQKSADTQPAFVPMAFSIKRIDDITGKPPYLLGFNEPDNAKQSDIRVEEALQAWPALVGKGHSIGAPAMAKNPVKPGNWLPHFMAKNPRVDFITVHWYKGVEAKKFIADIQEVCDAYGKPVWVTEFAPQTAADSREKPDRYSQADVDAFIDATTQWMEQSACVQRYAWHDAKAGTSALVKDGKLTATGMAYARAGR